MFNVITTPLLTILIFLYNLLGANLGLAIIALTLLIRLILVPLTLPAMRSTEKMKTLKPKLDELKAKYGKDKQKLQQEQMKLYQEHQINPAAGCLPYLAQFIVLIGLYQVFIKSLEGTVVNGSVINAAFLWMNLNLPDTTYIMPIVAGITQFIFAVMILPASDPAPRKALANTTPTKKDDKQADNVSEMAQTMQQQMVFVMPLMTVFIALRFPSGLALYWITTTLFSIIQQYYLSGWGGLVSVVSRLTNRVKPL